MNAYEMVMAAASAGVEPDDEDLAAVRPPPDVDEAAFRRTTAATARQIADLQRQGINGEARRRAQEASEEYAAAFTSLMPEPAAEQFESADVVGERMFRR